MRFMGSDQEIEFTVERGVLSVLQARAAELGADQEGAPFDDPGEPITHGLGIRGGGFRGLIAFDERDRRRMAAEAARRDDVDGVLILMENPTPDDIPLILSGDGLLTAKGGNTTHAAVAIHGIDEKNFCAVMSAAGLKVTVAEKTAVLRDEAGAEIARIGCGDVVSLHGTDGNVYLGTRRLVGRD
jgi:pyruvate,orthophosphate dikinase